MTPLIRKLAAAVFALLCAASTPSRADVIQVSMTVDNSYALFVGNFFGATTFVGSDFDWPTTETYNFTLDDTSYLYVVTASDRSTAQGFLGQFDNVTKGFRFYSSDAQWQVAATGLGSAAPYTGSSSDLSLLSTQIGAANAGTDVSGGWTSFTAGGANGVGPWGTRPGIDAAAHWVWYAGGNCSPVDPTIGGCDAGEWLIFRIAVAATPNDPVPPPPTTGVPEPETLALFGVGMVAAFSAGRARRRAQGRSTS